MSADAPRTTGVAIDGGVREPIAELATMAGIQVRAALAIVVVREGDLLTPDPAPGLEWSFAGEAWTLIEPARPDLVARTYTFIFRRNSWLTT